MRVHVDFTETHYKSAEIEVDEAEIRQWLANGGLTEEEIVRDFNQPSTIKEFLESGRGGIEDWVPLLKNIQDSGHAETTLDEVNL